MQDPKSLIRQCFLFSGAGDDAVAQLAAASGRMRIGAGQTVFWEGDDGGSLFIIESGLVRVWMSEPEQGKELTLAFLEPGDVFGEIAMLDGGARTASVTAVEDASMLEIQRSAFFEAVRVAPAFAEHVMELICERLRATMTDLNAIALKSLKRRLALKLCALAIAHGRIEGPHVAFARRFSQSELAHLLGATREAVNRHLSEWSREGVLQVVNGRLEILDLPALRAVHAAAPG